MTLSAVLILLMIALWFAVHLAYILTRRERAPRFKYWRTIYPDGRVVRLPDRSAK